MAKRKTKTRKQIVKELDTIFSQYIRLKGADKNGFGICVTCGKKDLVKNMDAGHFRSRRFYSTRWDEDNVNIQCKRCNIWGYGEEYLYSLYLGEKLSKKLYNKSQEIIKFANIDLLNLIEKYKILVKQFS